MTFRPRMGISTADMDLSVTLFGESLFTPILVGPIADQRLYHEDGELGTVRGAAAARTVTIVSSRSSAPLDAIARESPGPLWVGLYADGEGRSAAEAAVGAGADALFVTVGADYRPPEGPRPVSARLEPVDWRRLDSIRRGLTVPIAIKGVLTPADAASAVERGYQAIVVSDHGYDGAGGIPSPISTLPAIVDAAGGRIPILVDGSFRRGTDVLKALILGADGVLLGRPVAWGLSAYGADGVQWVLEKMQAERARAFAMVGASRPADLTRSHIRIHREATA
jgi:4-hydroxymandelate oxidase